MFNIQSVSLVRPHLACLSWELPTMVNFPLPRFWVKYLYILIVFLFTNGCTALVDDKSYVSASNTPTYLFDSGILKLKHTLSMPYGDGAHDMFFSHNGRYLVTTSSYSLHYNIWDMDTGEIAFQVHKYSPSYLKLLGPRRLISDIFSDYREAMFLPDDSALLLPKKEKMLPPPGVTNIAPVSNEYYADELYSYYYLDMKNPEIMRPALPGSLRSKYFLDNAVGSFSPDGKYFAQAGRTTTLRSTGHPDGGNYPIYGQDPFLKLYRTSDWKLVADVKKGFASGMVSFTPDGKYVVDYERVGDDDGIKPNKWELAYGNPYRKYKHNGIVKKEDYLDNLDKYEYPEIRFWSVPDLKLMKTIDNVFRHNNSRGVEKYPDFLSISPNGTMVALCGHDEDTTEILNEKRYIWNPYVKIFSTENGDVTQVLKDTLGSVYFSRDNQYLIIANSLEQTAIKVFSIKDWHVKEQVQFRKNARSLMHARRFNANRNLLAYGNGNIVYIWKVVEKQGKR